jgi:hypothetical protein
LEFEIRLGEKKFYPFELVNGALFINNKSELQTISFHLWQIVCGGKPSFYNSIDYVKLARLKKIENKRMENAKSHGTA